MVSDMITPDPDTNSRPSESPKAAPLQDHIDSLVLKYDDWHECDEYHIHDGTGEHEGHTPLPHDFDDTKFKQQLTELVHHRERIARNDELNRLLKPRDCLRPWCKVEHTYLSKLHVKARLAELNKEST